MAWDIVLYCACFVLFIVIIFAVAQLSIEFYLAMFQSSNVVFKELISQQSCSKQTNCTR